MASVVDGQGWSTFGSEVCYFNQAPRPIGWNGRHNLVYYSYGLCELLALRHIYGDGVYELRNHRRNHRDTGYVTPETFRALTGSRRSYPSFFRELSRPENEDELRRILNRNEHMQDPSNQRKVFEYIRFSGVLRYFCLASPDQEVADAGRNGHMHMALALIEFAATCSRLLSYDFDGINRGLIDTNERRRIFYQENVQIWYRSVLRILESEDPLPIGRHGVIPFDAFAVMTEGICTKGVYIHAQNRTVRVPSIISEIVCPLGQRRPPPLEPNFDDTREYMKRLLEGYIKEKSPTDWSIAYGDVTPHDRSRHFIGFKTKYKFIRRFFWRQWTPWNIAHHLYPRTFELVQRGPSSGDLTLSRSQASNWSQSTLSMSQELDTDNHEEFPPLV